MSQMNSYLPQRSNYPQYENKYNKSPMKFNENIMHQNQIQNSQNYQQKYQQNQQESQNNKLDQQMMYSQYQFQKLNTNNFDKNDILTDFKQKLRFYQNEYQQITNKQIYLQKDKVYFRKLKLQNLVDYIEKDYPQNLILQNYYCNWSFKDEQTILIWNEDSSYELFNQNVIQLNVLQIDHLSPLYGLIVYYQQKDEKQDYFVIFTSKQHDQIGLFDYFNNKSSFIYKYYKFDEINLYLQILNQDLQSWIIQNPDIMGQSQTTQYSGNELREEEKRHVRVHVILQDTYKKVMVTKALMDDEKHKNREKELQYQQDLKNKEKQKNDELLKKQNTEKQLQEQEKQRLLQEKLNQEKLMQEKLNQEKQQQKNQTVSKIKDQEKQFQQQLKRVVKFLTNGFTLTKFGLSKFTSGNKRTFYFEPDLEEFYYCDEDKDHKKADKTFQWKTIIEITDGRVTPNYKRFHAKTQDEQDLSFSIVITKRSFDLMAKNFNQKDQILESLNFLFQNYQKIQQQQK